MWHAHAERLAGALHPIDAMPSGDAWNLAEISDLLPSRGVQRDAAVLVGLVHREGVVQVLLTRRTDSLRHHPGQVSFPGGGIEATDAGAVAAALREAREEVGLAAAQASVVGFLDPLLTITGFRVIPVVAMLDPGFVATPDPAEVAAVFEVPLDYLMAPENLEEVAIDFGGRVRRVLEFRAHAAVPGQRIWGVTASILLNLRQRLEHRP